MECIEARALKSSFLSESAMKSTQQAFFDELWCVTGVNSVPADDFSVDDLLDLSDEGLKGGYLGECCEEDEEKDSDSVSYMDNENSNSATFSGTGDVVSVPAGELAIPQVDDLDNLEWLSRFVDDSASELSLLFPAGSVKEKTWKFHPHRSQPENGPPVTEFPVLPFSSPVPRRSRGKRTRKIRGLVWSFSTDSSSASSSSRDSSVTSPLVTNPVPILNSFWTFEQPPSKKLKRRPGSETGGSMQRRCTHCQVQKTPQWRTGPLGPKSLCNACGVRFKSGRLFPEYRPACSPTFSGDVHSNSHRKVLEMRRKKETEPSSGEPARSL